MTPKKYTLLKHLPMCNAGTEFVQFIDCSDNVFYRSTSDQGQSYLLPKETIENSEKWFKEVKPERISVIGFEQIIFSHLSVGQYTLVTSSVIPEKELPFVKEAIERVLNPDGETYSPISNVQISYDGINVYVGGEEYVSKKTVDSIRQDTWTAARRQVCQNVFTFDFFEDYIKSLQK